VIYDTLLDKDFSYCNVPVLTQLLKSDCPDRTTNICHLVWYRPRDKRIH